MDSPAPALSRGPRLAAAPGYEDRIRTYYDAVESFNDNGYGVRYGDVIHALNFDELRRSDIAALLNELAETRRELAEVAAHSHRYAADRTEAWAALQGIRGVLDTYGRLDLNKALDDIEALVDASGVQ